MDSPKRQEEAMNTGRQSPALKGTVVPMQSPSIRLFNPLLLGRSTIPASNVFSLSDGDGC